MRRRILLQDYGGYHFSIQLSRKLAERGHTVLHLFGGQNNIPRGNVENHSDDPATFKIHVINTRQPLEKYSFIKRWFQENEYGHMVIEAIKKFSPEIVISANMPLDPQALLIKYCLKHQIRFIFWQQDIISVAAKNILNRKIPLLGNWIGNYYISLEKRLLRQSNHVVPITTGFNQFLQSGGIEQDKITVIPNWAPLDSLPVLPKDNPWSRKHGLFDKFCFLYSGTLGLKHNPELLLQLALAFQYHHQVIIYVGSEGIGMEWLSHKKKELKLDNLLLMGYQRIDEFSQVLAAADVLLAILKTDSGEYSVPSKVLSYLTAQKPILLAVPVDNLAAKIVHDNNAGFVVSPDNPDEWIDKAKILLYNPLLCQKFGQNARKYAEMTFNIDAIVNRFEELMQ